MHREEIDHFYLRQEFLGPFGAVFALADIHGEERYIDSRSYFGYSVQYHGKPFVGLLDFSFGAFFIPMPVVEVTGMKYLVAVSHGNQIADTGVGRAESLYLYAFGKSFGDVAGAHPVYWHVIVYFTCGDIVRQHIYTAVALPEVEYVGVEMVGVVVGYKENHGLVGMVFKSLYDLVRRVAVVVEYKENFRELNQKARIVEECYLDRKSVV